MPISPDQSNRTGYIGGSDIEAVLNLEPYGCARRLHYRKTGAVPDVPFRITAAMQMGIWAEDGIAKIAAQRTGWKFIKRAAKQGEEWEGVHIDREIHGARKTPGVAEIKCIGNNVFWTWVKEGVPLGYVLQLQWGMKLWNRTWGAMIGWNKDGEENECKIFEIEYDPDLMNAVSAKVEAFWNGVRAGVLPAALPMDDARCEGCGYRATCFTEQWKNVADYGSPRMDHLSDSLSKFLALKQIKKETDEQIEIYASKIQEEMKDNELIQIGSTPVSWKVQESWRVDPNAIPEDQRAQYKRKSVSRVFRTHKSKEKS